jgi:hypothetical protein
VGCGPFLGVILNQGRHVEVTRAKIVGVVALALGLAVAIGWWALVRSRHDELNELRNMLPGAQVLRDEQLVAWPVLVLLWVMRRWVFSIDGEQRSRLLAQCREFEKQVPRPPKDRMPGCVAALHNDPDAYRAVTLTVEAHTAEVTALYLSSSDYADMERGL